jgi:hypothetical protein
MIKHNAVFRQYKAFARQQFRIQKSKPLSGAAQRLPDCREAGNGLKCTSEFTVYVFIYPIVADLVVQL